MTGRRITMMMAAVVAGMTLAHPADAQLRRWSFEGRLGASIPTGELSDASAQSGLSAEAEALYTFAPYASLFAGVGMHSFNCRDDEECDDITSRGFHGGLKYLFTQSGAATPWVRGGLLVHSADIDNEDSGMALGFEAGGGIDLALSEHFSLTPSLRFLRYNADFDGPDLTMGWFTLALGAHLHM